MMSATEIFILSDMKKRLSEPQNENYLQEILGGELTLQKYGQLIKPFLKTKSAPENLSDVIHTKGNTEAVIMVLEKSGIIKYITNKFFLVGMQMQMREKVQLMETFGAANVSFFGETARVYSFVANTIDASSQSSGIDRGKYFYQSSILKMYNEVLRGSQLIKEDRIAVLKVVNHLIYGYPINLQINYNASSDPVTSFNFSFVVAEHSLELPGVVTEKYLEKMYSTDAYINNQAIFNFLLKIDNIILKIDAVLNTKVDGEEFNSSGTIESVQNSPYTFYKHQTKEMKAAYINLLLNNVSALKTAIGSTLDGEISPLVHSKVPPQLLDKLLVIIPNMFNSEEAYNNLVTALKNISILKKELIIFKSYRLNRSEG